MMTWLIITWLLLNLAVVALFIARGCWRDLKRALVAYEAKRKRDRAFWRNLYRQSHR